MRHQYKSLGYCVLPAVFSHAELQPMRARLSASVDKLIDKLQSEGRLPADADLHEAAPLEARLALLGAQTDLAVRSWSAACQGVALYGMVTKPALLDAVSAVLGTPDGALPLSAPGPTSTGGSCHMPRV